ncbi:GGDEF domain-containing protein [Neorhizobium galegae]|uniref:GGDEF domain-containing protein n=1 Tax=Neorhizobium galegae TaxID=399 RepID=UPI0006225E8F|nr:GGDEF domain-containing protein [Neorhizobium galegae]MCQ1764002.1 GGDEF domain-containing protein [Neorhizobium galegae]MCQ1846557.1 GGDEF domain-containing protein [Neorhizobium galegae]CDZ35397.1 Diguanylate cyclase [Neorhizobium galegae bv. officinalis]
MMLDYHSLLLALGVSAACLMVTLFGTWYSRRSDSFLLTLVIALCLTVSGIFAYSTYTVEADVVGGSIAYTFLMAGFSTIYAASVQFRSGTRPWRMAAAITAAFLIFGLPLMIDGLDGLGFIVMNLGAAVLLLETARQYWRARREAPGPLIGMAVLYAATAVSFALCAIVLIDGQQWVLGHAPDNWAENLNIAVCIAGMTGIGALSLALHQWRMAAHHRHEAITDALTGLLNRRALFEQHGHRTLGSSTAVVVFDIDRFKAINDEHGHAAGDEVLRLFADDLRSGTKIRHTVARLGGEEFVMILVNVLPGRAERIANDISRRFAAREIIIGDAVLKCTVSAGVAVGAPTGQPFETVLGLADNALYEAKRAGRDRVHVAGYLRPVDTSETRTTA